ncbi:probable Nucleoporin NUP188 homolog at N-terminal half [Coccomyxa sp. Obi]|nr:probable Nucleoporin NUP188 homolog at N-terminal half [Coccomyxa sp. Obi]
MFDAAQLWWPPLERLYNYLTNSPQSLPQSFKNQVKDYDQVIKHNLGFFKRPNESSRKAIDQGAVLSVGSRKIPNAAHLRSPALQLSNILDLDEVQAYILLRRWQADHKDVVVEDHLTVEHLQSLGQAYFLERSYAIESLKLVLQLAEGDQESAITEVCSEHLQQWLSSSLEESLLSSLRKNLQAGSAEASTPQPQDGAVVVWDARTMGPPARAALAQPRMQQAFLERCALLEVLLLLYYSRPLTVERWLELARAVRSSLVLRGSASPAHQGSSRPNDQRADHLASLLLLETLDLETLLQLVAANEAPTAGSHRFGSPADRERISTELRTWWDGPSEVQTPVLLAWAAFLALANLTPTGAGEGEDYRGHAQVAADEGALASLAASARSLCGLAGSVDPLAGLSRSTLLVVLSSIIGAFGLSPARLPSRDLDHILQLLETVFDGQEELCASFWNKESPTEEPLRHFLHEARGLFPACPAPILRLLSALSSSKEAAVEANAYLARLDTLAQLHDRSEALVFLVEAGDAGEEAEATAPMSVLSVADAIPKGAHGSVHAVPLCAGAPASDDMASDGMDERVLVQWQLPMQLGAGQILLLSIVQEQLATLHQVVRAPTWERAQAVLGMEQAVAALSPAVHLLARMSSAQPALAVSLAQMRLPSGAGGTQAHGSRDLIDLIASALSVLPQLHAHAQLRHNLLSLLEDCLVLAGALAINFPARVLADLCATALLQPASTLGAAPSSLTGQQSFPRFVEQSMPGLQLIQQEMEAHNGNYCVSEAFLQMVCVLLQSGNTSPTLQAYVGFVVGHILPNHQRWRYASQAQRWRVNAAAIKVLRLALATETTCTLPAVASAQAPLVPDLAAAVRHALQQGGASYLWVALPPDAAALRALSLRESGAEVAAAEEAAQEWQRLLPLLDLGPGQPLAALSSSLFQVSRVGRPSPATILASLASYGYLDAAAHAEVLHGICALAQAAAHATRMSFAGFLAHASGPAQVPLLRSRLVEPMRVGEAKLDAGLYAGGAQLLIVALTHHPSLVDLLLFPSSLAEAAQDAAPAERSTAEDQAKRVALPAGKGGRKEAKVEAWSCLDGLWEAVRAGPRLRAQQPAVLAHALRALLAMWQAGAVAWRAVELVQAQPGMWQAVAGCLPEAAQRSLQLSAPDLDDGDEDPPEAWEARSDGAWRLAAEAAALQLLALDAFTQRRDSGGEAEGSARGLLDSWAKDADGGQLFVLLQRYSAPCGGRQLLAGLHRSADEAALELLSTALGDKVLGRSLQLPGSLLGSLHAAAQPLLRRDGSQEGVVAQLQEAVEGSDRGPDSMHAQFVAEMGHLGTGSLLLRAAEISSDVPEALAETRLAGSQGASPSYGVTYLYDAELLARRIGPEFARELKSVRRLQSSLRAVGVLVSTEDARQAALRAVRAAIAVSLRAADAPQMGTAVVAGTAAKGSRGGGVVASFSWLGASLSSAAEVAQVLVLVLQRWQGRGKAAGSGRAPSSDLSICADLLHICRAWLSGRGVLRAEGELLEELEGSVLAALLLALQRLPPLLNGAPRSEPRAALRTALAQAVGPLLELCRGAEGSSATALAIVSTIIQRHLSPSVWLPLLQQAQVNLVDVLELAFQGVVSSHAKAHAKAAMEEASTLMGTILSLTLTAVQHREAAQLLADQGLTGCLLAMAAWMVAPDGGGLGSAVLEEPMEAGQGARRPASAAPQGADYAGAYSGSCQPVPVHQHWLSLCAIVGVMVRALPGWARVEADAVAVLVAAEERLLLALEPPAATPAQPLTLAMLQETERVAFLLTSLARLLGQWQMALPASLSAARETAASFLAFAGLPTATDTCSVHCPPVSPAEKAQAGESAGLPVGEAWFEVCAEGSRAASGSARDGLKHSDYSASLAEALYGCVAQTLSFLCAVAPEVGEEEVAAGLGPEWPEPRLLGGLQQQCLAMSFEVCQRSMAGNARAARLCRTLLAILAMTRRLQAAQGFHPDPALAERIRDGEARMSAALQPPQKNAS